MPKVYLGLFRWMNQGREHHLFVQPLAQDRTVALGQDQTFSRLGLPPLGTAAQRGNADGLAPVDLHGAHSRGSTQKTGPASQGRPHYAGPSALTRSVGAVSAPQRG